MENSILNVLLKMNKIINKLLLLLIVCFCFSSYADQVYTVKFVVDGDTIILSNRDSVRYIGIDSPEINHKTGIAEPFGFEAKTTNEKLLSGKSVRLEYDIEKKDHYGRILAYVYTSDGIFINSEIIKNGYAWTLFKRPNTKHSDELLISQRYAMLNKQGIWSNWKEKKSVKYIGNSNSKRFHLSDCPFGKKISSKNRIIFQKKWDAFYAGFSPCKKCILEKNDRQF